jgi:DNA-3-methyladenine glycosylase I
VAKTLNSSTKRCVWAGEDPLMIDYHDREWGVPVHDDRKWFQKILLDGAQAGLSWSTILRKREGYRAAFCDFDPARVVRFKPADVERLMLDPGIVRNRLKIESAIKNARGFLAKRCSMLASTCAKFRPRLPFRMRCPKISNGAASRSWARRSSTRSCSQRAW